MFDKIKFYQAAALLKSFRSNLPKGYVWMSYIEDYHQYLADLQEQVRIDLSKFRIPPSAIKRKVTRDSTRVGQFRFTKAPQTSPVDTHCNRDVFKRQLDAVILFIDTYTEDLKSSQK